MANFQDIGPNNLKPDSMKRIELNGLCILIANIQGALYAVQDTCTHEDASLYQGALEGDCVRCPLHGSRFCLTNGRAIDDPAEIDLAVFSVFTRDGRIFVSTSA
ncbi:MAG TPA: non-heme iron oxygenase ferredoxin subunit [Gammaproteobacteria bacterium]|nr:non-heme iron oxygenase ferredoxin subunit [Gammaproteobacteria bacterium]HIL19971.1 non-heme iron oxygenase ferredoxin subunit [Gammaproteobacteria bacterium]